MTSRLDLLDVKRAHEALDKQTAERRAAWDAYIAAICRGAGEEEVSRLYWAAVRLTDRTVQ